MNPEASPNLRKGYCIFTDTFFQGSIPTVSGSVGKGPEKYCVFETELEAQREIADFMMTRLQEFMDGERDFEDATSCDEYVVEVTINADGMLVDEHGRIFKPTRD